MAGSHHLRRGRDREGEARSGPLDLDAVRNGTASVRLVVPAPARGEGQIEIWPTDNMDALRRVVVDPRHFGDPSSRELYGLVQLMDAAAYKKLLEESD